MIMLADINERLTQAAKQLRELDCPFDTKDLALLVGEEEWEDIKSMRYSHMPMDENGLTIMGRIFNQGLIKVDQKNYLELCWLVPRIFKIS